MDDKSLNLTVLGSGSAVPYDGRASAAYLISFNQHQILFDAGFSVVERLDSVGVRLDELDAVFITHKHPDHFMGLIHILFALKNPLYQRSTPLKVIGFKGLESYLNEFQNILGKWIAPTCGVEIVELESGAVCGAEYSLFPVHHSEESIGIKLSVNDRSIVYTGDSEYFSELINHCNGADLVIADCAGVPSQPVKGHMDYEAVIRLASKASVKKMMMSHFYPGTDRFEFFAPDHDFELYMARDLMEITV